MLNLTLAYSPCPNDTFLFYYMVHQKLSSKFTITEVLHDVEQLNISAKQTKFDVTKLSFYAYFEVMENYKLLTCGSALGRGCGPILVKKKNKRIRLNDHPNILVPGLLTTANLLLNLHLKNQYNPVPVRYDCVTKQIAKGDYDLGVIIHEERFTFEERGLEKVVDLGEWWENETSLPIPLGAIAIKRDLQPEIQVEFNNCLSQSLALAYEHPEKTKQYILSNSISIEEEIARKHIDLYVNDFTKNIGEEGKKAILTLLEKAQSVNLLPIKKLEDIFI
ncbi:MAG: 1,4-dihydroxy-6-naphthoate synthase [Leptospiraceae bacterium]|nr:1,4-dihydroxy-6-naphthoate synthase [Leptospiraceae bacterium]MCP5498202.1 1,4-dihydroxy-6-naphthoate synthase [Leptospiraceae bacterium]